MLIKTKIKINKFSLLFFKKGKKIKIDINDVLDLAGTKPFGFTKFSPGPGYGGHCIPLDPFYLYWLAKKNNFELKFIKAAGLINRQITDWITKKIIKFW